MHYNFWNYAFQNLMMESSHPNVELMGRTYVLNFLVQTKGRLRREFLFYSF